MEQINQLRAKLRPHLGWHGARLSFVAMFLIALFRAKTVNLAELATVCGGKAADASHYKRMQRFFRSFDLDMAQIAQMLVKLAGIPQPWVLSLDRTNWSFGKTHFNILMLGVVHEGIAFPLLWTLLEKQGNSNSDERMDLLDRFEALFPDVVIAYLTADREFIGQEWLSYLLMDKPIPFRIRIRQSDLIRSRTRQQAVPGSRYFANLSVGETRVLSGHHWVWGRPVYVIGARLQPTQKGDDNFLILVTNHCPEQALSDYTRRWGIETLFAALKTRGFCLESTHFNDAPRLSKLLALLAIAFVWAMKTGLWQHTLKPIPIKSHQRRAKSLFRLGFDYLRSIFTNLDHQFPAFLNSLHFLSCT
ncbi:MAG: IS4 family transposase [Moorea sp. SIO1F2]|uniref:IS4 family transposase n=1 Tax=unclassified Moorena TaxID=2683338 RepID=UPI0013BABBD4|nr:MULTISPECIES: IS4 family transposase [unclassified Moorena]NEP29364.1 IS4 family transposase [Moorena sp. SIO3I6]NET86484.1 IS4 family transposase [Moorena sp. SIO1F2]